MDDPPPPHTLRLLPPSRLPPPLPQSWLWRPYFSRSIYTYDPLVPRRYSSWSRFFSGNIRGLPVSREAPPIGALGACSAGGRHAPCFLDSISVKDLQDELRAAAEKPDRSRAGSKANKMMARPRAVVFQDKRQDDPPHQGQYDGNGSFISDGRNSQQELLHHHRVRAHDEDEISHGYHGNNETASEFEAGSSANVERRQMALRGRRDSSSHNKVAPEDQEVVLSELYLGHKFASGAHSCIYLGRYKGSDVAVKVLRIPDDGDEEKARLIEQEFRNEAHILSRIRHRNVIKFYGACEKSSIYCIVTEFLALGSVRSFLNRQGSSPLSLKVVINMALDIAQGMEYLHSQGVLHCDLKSENLLLQGDLGVKIADFGAACYESERATPMVPDKNHVGTYRWMAPEMIRHKRLSRKVDVYSFGIVLWELLTGHVPFEDLSPVQAAYAVVNKHARPHLPTHCPDKLGLLLNQCWSHEPNKRPEFSHIVQVLKQVRESSDTKQRINPLARPWNPLLNCLGCIDTSNLYPSSQCTYQNNIS